MTLAGAFDDALDKCGIVDVGGAGGSGKLAGLFEVTACVDFDDINLVSLGQAHVDAPIIAHAQGAIGVEGRFL